MRPLRMLVAAMLCLQASALAQEAVVQVSAPRPRSAPAQNARPSPVTITHLIASSASDRSNASINSCAISALNAFSWSGRLLMSQPTDTKDEFAAVFDFDQAFEREYPWSGVLTV